MKTKAKPRARPQVALGPSALTSARRARAPAGRSATQPAPRLGARPAEPPNHTGIPTPVLRPMERFFGADFSGVRVHVGSQRAVGARALAFAQGSELHFAPGKFQPESPAGRVLLGHELAHVVQQRAGRVQATAQLAGGDKVNNDPALEREAWEQGRAAAGAVRTAAAEPDGAVPVEGGLRVGAAAPPVESPMQRSALPTDLRAQRVRDRKVEKQSLNDAAESLSRRFTDAFANLGITGIKRRRRP